MADKVNKLYFGANKIAPGAINMADGPSESDLSTWQGRIDKTLDSLQSGKLRPEDLDRDLFDLTLNDLKKGFSSSFGKEDISFGNPDYNFLTEINKNLYRFAGAKSYQELSDMSNMLIGDDGKTVDFKTFRANIDAYRASALGIDDQYNGNWLYTEYTNAVNSGLAAKRWKEFEDTAELFPNLEYRTAGDSQVRASHRELNGIIKPINDPFWDTYYPPNDWGCRCRCRPTSDGPKGKAPDDFEVPELFNNNVGKTGAIFNESHPYFNQKGISRSKTFATVRRFETDDHYAAQLPKYKQLNAKYETLSAINEAGGSIHQEAGFMPFPGDLDTARKLSLLGDSVVLLKQEQPQATALVQGEKSVFGSAAAASDITASISNGLSLAGTFTVGLAKSVKKSAVISALTGFNKDPRFRSVIFLKGGKRCVITTRDLALKDFTPLSKIGL